MHKVTSETSSIFHKVNWIARSTLFEVRTEDKTALVVQAVKRYDSKQSAGYKPGEAAERASSPDLDLKNGLERKTV